MRGIGAVFGAPIAGAILGNHPGSTKQLASLAQVKTRFNFIAGFDAALLLLAGVCVVFVRLYDARYKRTWQWNA
jgi:hypothetical protein